MNLSDEPIQAMRLKQVKGRAWTLIPVLLIATGALLNIHMLGQLSTGPYSASRSLTVSRVLHHCFYRDDPSPQHHSGLPFLADVFATADQKSIYIVGVNKGMCFEEWKGAQEFHSTPKQPHRFLCSFSDGSITSSDPVHRKFEWDEVWTNTILMIRCPIPSQLQKLVPSAGASMTTFTVNLHATEDLEASGNKTQLIQPSMGEPHQRYSDLPVCSNAWPSPLSATTHRPPRRYKVTLTTRVTTGYAPSTGNDDKGTRLAVTREMVVAWIEYHLAIGIEQFYIYDSSLEENGPMFKWLRPYIEQDQVTYIYYPYKDCLLAGSTSQYSRLGQYASSNAALRRYMEESEWMGHWDLDEYLIIARNTSDSNSKEALIKQIDQIDGGVDVMLLRRKIYEVCQGEILTQGMVPTERQKCGGHDQDQEKGLYRTNTMLYCLVHHGVSTLSGAWPKTEYFEYGRLFLGHYQQRPNNPYDAPGFEGKAEASSSKKKAYVLQNWTQYLHEQLDAHFTLMK